MYWKLPILVQGQKRSTTLKILLHVKLQLQYHLSLSHLKRWRNSTCTDTKSWYQTGSRIKGIFQHTTNLVVVGYFYFQCKHLMLLGTMGLSPYEKCHAVQKMVVLMMDEVQSGNFYCHDRGFEMYLSNCKICNQGAMSKRRSLRRK